MEWKRNNEVIKKPILEYLEDLINEETEKGYKLRVFVGTDSQKYGTAYKFATVIILARTEDLGDGVEVGRGGLVMASTHVHKFKARNKEAVNERMIYEVGKSVEVAYEIASLLDLYEIPLEVHADINPNPMFESNKAMQQAVGYILGMGYEFKIKPDAFASSYCADNIL